VTPVLMIRHGPTAWNASGRIQGRADVGLSVQGRAAVARWRLPAPSAAMAVTSQVASGKSAAAASHAVVRFGAAEPGASLLAVDPSPHETITDASARPPLSSRASQLTEMGMLAAASSSTPSRRVTVGSVSSGGVAST
jgi:hypothetical protein